MKIGGVSGWGHSVPTLSKFIIIMGDLKKCFEGSPGPAFHMGHRVPQI